MKYDVALSFAEEDGKYVEEVARELEKLEFRVFYDDFETADLYERQSRFTLIFVSESYVKKLRNSHFETILPRLFQERRLLIARFDEAVIEALAGKSFFDLKETAPGKFAYSIAPVLKSYLFDNTNAATFISKIRVNKSRNIFGLTLNLSDENRKHLILTGKNGSGKTSLLNDLSHFFQVVVQNGYGNFISQIENLNKFSYAKSALIFPETDAAAASDEFAAQLKEIDTSIKRYQSGLKHFGGNEVYFTNPQTVQHKVRFGELILKYFGARRQADFHAPSGIEKVKINQTDKIDEPTNSFFIQYLVNLKAEKSFANDDGETEAVERIDQWFEHFENKLRDIFDSPNLKLKFDRKNYNFEIIEDDKPPSGLDKLPDGYAAILNIVSELIMKAPDTKAEDLEGVALIDEIETHLDVDLQKKVLPFLIDFFPKIQFIVSTHSPFVLSSISNAVICDLEKRTVISEREVI